MGDGIPIGFEHISLIEALNGPAFTRRHASLTAGVDPLLDSSDLATVMGLNSTILRKKYVRVSNITMVKERVVCALDFSSGSVSILLFSIQLFRR